MTESPGATGPDPDGRSQVVALQVAPNGPADRAGIRVNDVLEIDSGGSDRGHQRCPAAPCLRRRLGESGLRGAPAGQGTGTGVDVPASVIVGEAARGIAITWQYVVGVAYLAIGLFVYFRRGSAYKARHFYIFCLASFIFSCFHYTGKLNAFDQVIDWGNLIAGWLAPALFLHFCLTFPEPRAWYRNAGTGARCDLCARRHSDAGCGRLRLRPADLARQFARSTSAKLWTAPGWGF